MKRYIITIAIILGCCILAHAQDSWIINAKPESGNEYYGTTVANGQLGLVSSKQPLKVDRVVLGGVYDMYGRGRVSNFVHGIKMLDLDLRINGSSMNMRNISDYQQTLDMYNGSFGGTFRYKNLATVSYCYQALRNLPFSAMMEVEISPKEDLVMRVENILEIHESLKDSKEFFVTVKSGDDRYSIATSTAYTPTGAVEVGASSVIIPDAGYLQPQIEHLSTRGIGVHSQSMEVNLKKGKPYRFYVIGSTLSSLTHTDVRNELERLSLFCAVEGPARLLKKHQDLWHELWQSDIVIEGDAQSQQDVHNMLFHIYGSVREGSGLSVSPMALSGFGYNGHVFWDCETWVFPALLMLHPELASSWLDYRYYALEAAKKNAYMYGCRGAKYPWESAASGREETPSQDLYGPFEIHISADVALACWQYYQVTGDIEWLQHKGYPIIKECADYYVSRVDKRDDGTYDLINVIGADEWNVNPRKGKNVNNNAYTIGVVKTNLIVADKIARLLNQKSDTMWLKVANGLNWKYLSDGIIKEHDTYQPGCITKQADVSLLSYPLDWISDSTQIQQNLEYYLNTVPRKDTPAMSKSVYSILYSRLRNQEKAWYYFQDSYIPNLRAPFRVIAEFDGGTNPYFITGAGGTIQSILMGFGGLKITEEGIISDKTLLPSSWTSLTLKGIGKDKKTFQIK